MTDVLRDPVDGGRLRAHDGALLGADGRRYPIVDGIARFVSADNYAGDFGAQWRRFPRTQLDSHTGLPISRTRLARCLGGNPAGLAGQLVLEAGSGAGRFTEILLAAGATVHSFDFSNAVEANRANHGAHDRLTLVQADIRQIPFAAATYDLVLCLGVLQHTPSPEQSIASLWHMVKPGGRLVIDHYRHRLRFRLPTPIGDAGSVYRWGILRLPGRWRWPVVRRVTDFWFPLHWRWRRSRFAQRLLRRLSPVRFYYPELPLRDRAMHYQWSLLDTHDSTTDVYKHLRRPEQIRHTLEQLGGENIEVRIGGNGIEASARKPMA